MKTKVLIPLPQRNPRHENQPAKKPTSQSTGEGNTGNTTREYYKIFFCKNTQSQGYNNNKGKRVILCEEWIQ